MCILFPLFLLVAVVVALEQETLVVQLGLALPCMAAKAARPERHKALTVVALMLGILVEQQGVIVLEGVILAVGVLLDMQVMGVLGEIMTLV